MKFVKRGDNYFLYPESEKETTWVKGEFAAVRQLKGRLQGDDKTGIYVEVKLVPVEPPKEPA